MGADRSLDHLYPVFRTRVSDILADLNTWCGVHYPGHLAIMVEGFRTSAYQASLFAQGRTTKGSIVTQRNGTTNPSVHQSSLAADIVPQASNGNIIWEPPQEFWDYLGHLARAEGLEYGGDWKGGFVDIDHIQWKETDKPVFASAHVWQMSQGLR